MATMEKPKTKKKKTRIRNNESTNNDFEEINFPMTSTTKCDEIISHDCFVSAEFQSIDATADLLEKDENLSVAVQSQSIVVGEQQNPEQVNYNIEDNSSDSQNKFLLDDTFNSKESNNILDDTEKSIKLDVNTENKDEEFENSSQIQNLQEIVESTSASSNIDINLASTINNVKIKVNEQSDDMESTTNLRDELVATGIKDIQIGSPHPWTHYLEPTAPIVSYSKTFNNPEVKYPSLGQIRINEEKTENIGHQIQTKLHLMPFTKTQLKELYCCHEIEMVKKFEIEFLTNSLNQNFESDPLYLLLQQYALCRNKIRVNLADMELIQEQLTKMEKTVWEVKNKTVNFKGTCADNVTVRGYDTYEVIELNSKVLHLLSGNLNKLYELVCFSITTNNINAEIAKFKVEQIVREILSYSTFSKITSNSPMSLAHDNTNSHGLNHLRRAISIFFACIRKPPPDQDFTNDLKAWISTLIGLYLRVATREDHWFLLFHILRCPSGVSSWAKSFLQIPCPRDDNFNKLESEEINHCISILNILLLPIKKRNEFLQALTRAHKEISDPVKEDIWILVDSDGEEGITASGECAGLKENDLIAFLNQIPLEMIFRSIINAKIVADNDYVIENDGITEKQLIKIIAFNSNLIDLFGEGLLTYNKERYKQFAKRLGRLIRHTIQYVSDIHEMFLRKNSSKDPYMCERIITELNSFTIKACSYIYKTPNLATWQYFSSLPFSLLDSETIWQLFYYLNVGFPDDIQVVTVNDCKNKLNETEFWNMFQLAVTDLSAEDLYYLIQTFYEIANERDRAKDWDLIQIIGSHIFNVGFVNRTTREICYKIARDMLVNLTLTYPDLIEILVQNLRMNFQETENALYLFKSLPLHNWKTDIESFEIFSYWLLNFNYDSNENILARVIIGHMNWGFDIDDRLFLPHNIHVQMACLICQALNKHNPETIGLSGISESVRQVSNFMEYQSSKEQFTSWCWNMVSLLKLHQMDQSIDIMKKMIKNPKECLYFIPELDNFPVVVEGVAENRPLAIYVSVLVSLCGHSIPLICQKGFPMMKLLLNDYRHLITIRCIELIVPLFLETPDTLWQNEMFQEIVKSILNSDRTYLKMAKDLVRTNSPGPVFELFIDMIQSQIINYSDYGLQTPTPLIILWLQILTSVQSWQTMNVVDIIDNILKISYQFPDSWQHCKKFLQEYYENCNDWKSDRSSTLKMFLGSSGQNRNFPNFTTRSAWLALILLELEFETQELRLWPEFLRQLLNSSVDTALKKASTVVGLSNQIVPSSLVVYKYASLISVLDFDHPLIPVLIQNFFILYLWRIEDDENRRFQDNFGVADKIYEYNISLMKKLKLKFKQSEEHFLNLAKKHQESDIRIHFYSECSKIMRAYLLWLEETNLNKISKDQHIDLPPQYNANKLKLILNKADSHWKEFLYLPDIRQEHKEAAARWLKNCLRFHKINPCQMTEILSKPKTTPIERIKKHLKSYDKPLAPPEFEKKPLLLKHLKASEISNDTLSTLRKEMKFLNEVSKKLDLRFKEVNSLNGNYKDQIQLLYTNVTYSLEKIVPCSSMFSNSSCKNPAKIQITLQRPQKMETIQRKLDENREKHSKIINDILNQNVDDLVFVMQKIENTIQNLIISQTDEEQIQKSVSADNVAINFFYDVLLNESIPKTLMPMYETCSNALRELGNFIRNNQESEGIKILEISLKRPELLELLSDLLIPSRIKPEYFLNMYGFIIDSHMRRCDNKVLFVLMSKFDLPNWFRIQKPKLSEISRLLQLISMGLENWNQPETALLQDLFRRHLVYIFEHEFPEHYGEVLQIVLNLISEQKISSLVLIDLLNSLLLRTSGCEEINLEEKPINLDKIQNQIILFSTKQNLFNFKSITDTLAVFAKHFQQERLQHGLHGLYPKHKNYCFPLSLWYTCLSHTSVVCAICSYPGVLGDQICDWLFAPLIDLYSPWIIVYREKDLNAATANWIKQFIRNGKSMSPWSELHVESAQIILQSFVNNLIYILSSLPVSNSILGHVYSWYQYHFATSEIESFIRNPVHSALSQLPWERFKPQPNHIETIVKVLQEYLPECHAFIGHIFLRIQWPDWKKECFDVWPSNVQEECLPMLFAFFTKISFEPHVHDELKTSQILSNCVEKYSWHLIDDRGIEIVFNWLLLSVEPAIVLKIPPEYNETDYAVLRLLQVASEMTTNSKSLQCSKPLQQSRRLLYTRTIAKLLKSCTTKNQRLLETSEGSQAFRNCVVELLNDIETLSHEKYTDIESLIQEIIGPLQFQNEYTSKTFVDAIIFWQSTCKIGSWILSSILSSIGLFKTFNHGVYLLLESTIYNYFKVSDDSRITHSPTWVSVLKKLGNSINNAELNVLLKGPYLLSLHVFILHCIQNLPDFNEKITFLQDLSQLLEAIKTNSNNESRIVIIWGAIICCGCKILNLTENARKPLLMLARHLLNISKQCDGWGDSLLGVIGLKWDKSNSRRKILTKSLSCMIFSLFPDNSGRETKPSKEYQMVFEELKLECNNKATAEVRLITSKALYEIEENLFPRIDEVSKKIFNLINLFYNDGFIKSVEDVWQIEKS